MASETPQTTQTQTSQPQGEAQEQREQRGQGEAAGAGGTQIAPRSERGGRSTAMARPFEPMFPSVFGAPAFGVSPFGFVRRMMEDMDRVFSEFGMGGLIPGGREAERGAAALWSPQVDVHQRGDQLVIRADVPGMREQDIEIEVQDDAVVISGERRTEREESGEGMYRSERAYGRFRRAIPLPEDVDTDSAAATLRDGVLEVSMKRSEPRQRARRLEIRSGDTAESERSGGESGQKVH